MTAHTSLALLKAQLNIDHDHDDALLLHKLEAAEWWISQHTGLPFYSVYNSNPALTEAALQLASYWYEQREAAFDGRMLAVPFGVRDLLESYKVQVTGHGR